MHDRHNRHLYTVYYNNNQLSQNLNELRCCHGDIYVYYDYLPHASPKTTQQTGIRATRSGIPLFTDPPEVPITSDPKNTSVLVTILVSLALLRILGAAALLYRRYRKLRSALVKKIPATRSLQILSYRRYRITETVDDGISPTTNNYFVLEVTEGIRSPTTSPSSNTAPIPFSSSEYETVQMKDEPEKPSEGVYNTLRENSTLPDDVTDNYSRLADFNQENCNLQR